MNTLKLTIFLVAWIVIADASAQSGATVNLVSKSNIDVKYTGGESYVAYLNRRGLSKDNVFKEYYTAEFSFDLGKLKPGETKEVKIPFKNVSDAYVRITTINEICDCLQAAIPTGEAGTLKPGDVKEGKVKFNTAGLSGKVRRAIEVRTFTNRKEINYLVWLQAEIGK